MKTSNIIVMYMILSHECLDRSIHDALCVVRSLVKKKALIAGGSAPEMEVAQKLEAWARRGVLTLKIS